VNFPGQKRSNKTHESTTDTDLRLFKKTKGSEAKLAYQGHLLMENRNCLVVNATLTSASGTAEREAALAMLSQRPQRKRITVGGDKAYDTKDFVADLRACQVMPHVAQNNKGRRSAIDQIPVATGRNVQFLPAVARYLPMEKQLIVLGYVNHHPGKTLSICLFESCSHQEFRLFCILYF
jgi:hypothetical protein